MLGIVEIDIQTMDNMLEDNGLFNFVAKQPFVS